MIVSAQTKGAARIFQNPLLKGKRSHGTVAFQTDDLAVFNSVLLRSRRIDLEIGAVGIIVFATRLMDAGILKQIRRIDPGGRSHDTDHIFAQLHHSRRAGSSAFPSGTPPPKYR